MIRRFGRRSFGTRQDDLQQSGDPPLIAQTHLLADEAERAVGPDQNAGVVLTPTAADANAPIAVREVLESLSLTQIETSGDGRLRQGCVELAALHDAERVAEGQMPHAVPVSDLNRVNRDRRNVHPHTEPVEDHVREGSYPAPAELVARVGSPFKYESTLRQRGGDLAQVQPRRETRRTSADDYRIPGGLRHRRKDKGNRPSAASSHVPP
jgi:hypothetical protein